MFNLLKRVSLFFTAIVLMSSVSYSQDDMKMESKQEKSMEPVGVQTTDGMLYGKDYDPGMTAIDFGDLLKNSEANNDQVILVKGNVSEVCQSMGCWMVMTDGANKVRATTSHNFFLPKDIAGRDAVIYGKFKVTEISQEEAQHYNEESKNPLKNESIVGPQKVYEIDAIGIKILNPAADSDKN